MLAAHSSNDTNDTLERVGVFALRYGLVLIFIWFGILKFTAYEAEGIAPFAMNSPFLSWAYKLLGQQGFAMALGLIELAVGILIALRAFSPKLSAAGSIGSIITFAITLTLLLSTPGVWQEGYGFPFLSGASVSALCGNERASIGRRNFFLRCSRACSKYEYVG